MSGGINVKKVKSIIFLFITAITWGFAFVAQRVGSGYVEPLTFNATRYILGTLSLIPVILIFEKEKFNKTKFSETLKAGLIAGVVLTIAANVQQYGVVLTQSAGLSGFLTGLYIVLVPILGLLIFRKKTNILTWLGALVAVVGLYFLCVDSNSTFSLSFGVILLTADAIVWALHIIVIDYYVEKVSPLKFAMIQFGVCAVISLVGALLFEDVALSAVWDAKLPILYGGVMSVGVAYTCQILGQRDSDPTFAAIILSTESVFGAIGGALILDERFVFPYGYIGCILIFAGIILSQVNIKKKKTVNIKNKQ